MYCLNSRVWRDDHPLLSMVNHTHGCSWLIQSNRKAPFAFLFLFLCKFFFSQLQLMNFSGCLDVSGLAVWGSLVDGWDLEGTHGFSNWGIRSSHRKTGLGAGQADPLGRLTVTLVSLKGFEWHLGLLPILVRRLHVCELQEDAIWRAHLQVRGWAFRGKFIFPWFMSWKAWGSVNS